MSRQHESDVLVHVLNPYSPPDPNSGANHLRIDHPYIIAFGLSFGLLLAALVASYTIPAARIFPSTPISHQLYFASVVVFLQIPFIWIRRLIGARREPLE